MDLQTQPEGGIPAAVKSAIIDHFSIPDPGHREPAGGRRGAVGVKVIRREQLVPMKAPLPLQIDGVAVVCLPCTDVEHPAMR